MKPDEFPIQPHSADEWELYILSAIEERFGDTINKEHDEQI